MTDNLSRMERSRIMSKIRRTNTSPERQLSAAIRSLGLRYATQYGPARADFAIPRARIAIFVDGCFWHGCPVHFRLPKSNREYWTSKIRYNTSRDRRLRSALRSQGWMVIRVWEHSLPRFAGRYAALVKRRALSRTGPPAQRRPEPGQGELRFQSGQSAPGSSR